MEVIYQTRKTTHFQTPRTKLKIRRVNGACLANFVVIGNVVKHCLELWIYLPNRN